jgi:hypothetical protein
MDPHVYGRSILENSSFIASSDCPDPMARGRGFIARLSGTTAEFIHIWLLLTAGKRPFTVHKGQLCLALQPALPARWFTEEAVDIQWNKGNLRIPENAFACTLLGSILLVYHNPNRQNTYGKNGVQPVRYLFDNQQEVAGSGVTGALAEMVRQRAVKRIDVWLD